MLRKTYFISTDLELNIDKKNKKILAGNWCIDNNKKNTSQRYEILENFWKNKSKINIYYKYLQKLSLSYSIRLSSYLNSYHNKKFSANFWKIVLLPWLIVYLPAYYYRWLAVRKILKKKVKINYYDLYNLEKKNSYTDTFDFYTKISTNKFINYNIFYNLMKYHKEKNDKIIFQKKKFFDYDKKKNFRGNKLLNFIFLIFNPILNIILNFLFKLNKIFIEKGVFPIRSNIEMSLKLKQIPTYPNDTFNNSFGYTSLYEYEEINLLKRRSLNLGKKGKNDDAFVKYIDTIIRDDIPKCFVEGFDKLKYYSEKIKFRPKIILSSYYHYFNELFKVWTAHLTEKKKTKLFIACHGGGGFLKHPSCLNFETEVANIKINWHRSKKKKEIQLPASRFLSLKKKNFVRSNSISFIQAPICIYPARIGFNEVHDEKLVFNFEFLKFYRKIYKSLQNELIFIPNSVHGKDTTQNLKNDLKLEQIKNNKSFDKYKYNSKLNIVSYPQTVFFESIITTPTLLLCKKNEWTFDEKFQKFYKKLVKNNIIFHDPVKAAKHVNIISSDINSWWNSRKIQLILKDFLDHTCVASSVSKDIWLKLLKKKIN